MIIFICLLNSKKIIKACSMDIIGYNKSDFLFAKFLEYDNYTILNCYQRGMISFSTRPTDTHGT